jgi:hypothetical protein
MNLYNFSQDNNIEAGVLTNRKGILGSITAQDTLEKDAAGYFQRVVEQSDLLFLKEPKFESNILGILRRYIGSEIETDILSDFFNNKLKSDTISKKQTYIPKQSPKQMGFCIRTGTSIPFNAKLPMCDSAFQSWKKFSNNEYPEKFCHFSGEPSNGETSFSKPILRKNWANAKEVHML